MEAVFAILGLVCAIVSLVCVIIILIAAFKEGAGTGILCLCVPFYILYFAFARFEHPQKGLIIAGWIVGGIIGNVLSTLAGAGAQ